MPDPVQTLYSAPAKNLIIIAGQLLLSGQDVRFGWAFGVAIVQKGPIKHGNIILTRSP
jgi:predicted RecA/RadA family phage recombinase